MLGEIQAGGAGAEGLPPATSAAVSIRTRATESSLELVAAVASGAAEALDLDLEPTIRLRTISLEAAGNVVEHAYPDGEVGPLQLLITPDPVDEAIESGQRPIHVSVLDEGVGCGLPPSSADPPGLGLPMISSLAEAFTLQRGVDGGTVFDATIIPDAEPDVRPERVRAPEPDSCWLDFGDSSFLQPVLTRALAAQNADEEVDIGRLGMTLELGDTIADALAIASSKAPVPSLLISRDPSAPQVSIWIGPLLSGMSERLTDRVSKLAEDFPGALITTERGEIGGDFALVTMPLAQT